MSDLTKIETEYIKHIRKKTAKHNIDNISRTNAYQNYYLLYPEIKWSFLASMVSRNAGWNITDLETPTFRSMLSPRHRKQLFSTYERANWLIFSDAYPQLLVYQISIKLNQPLFYLLPYFSVSNFMKKEWEYYWNKKDDDRLLTSLIINEQNVIQQPVSHHPFFRKHVFMNWPYLMQDFFHMSAVIFPSRTGYIFAVDVHDFSTVTNRITLGKKLASVLFDSSLYRHFYDFAIHTEHTGSRRDYERYLDYITLTSKAPMLRTVYPIIKHQDKIRKDWLIHGGFKKKWWKEERVSVSDNIWESFYRKREALKGFHHIKKSILKK